MLSEAFAVERARVLRFDSAAARVLDSSYTAGGYQAAMRVVTAIEAKRRRGSSTAALGVAQFYLLGGETRQVFDWLERAYTEHDPNLPYVSALPLSDPIRGDPRFQDLLRRMGLPDSL
jgi:hypothetical protein